MPDSLLNPPSNGGEHPAKTLIPRPCDFCGESTALLYCRADAANLCLYCDREVHSTNPLFAKHTRSLLCDSCHSSPASIFCSTDSSVCCQNCDWETHNSAPHDRRPLEGFTGCPSVTELLSILGFEDFTKKGLLRGEGSDSFGSHHDGFSDYLVWDTPSFVSLDDLIVSSGSEHNYPAMGVPPLPKNRNAVCGGHKDELLHQLREMAKLEPNTDDDQGIIKPLGEFQPEQNTQLQDMCAGFEHKSEPNLYSSYEASAFQWCSDTGDFGDQELSSTQLGSYAETNVLVPDKGSDIGRVSSLANGGQEGQSQHPAVTESLQVNECAVRVAPRDLNSQERDSALSRYKEKKKSRRYDKHIRYESRKVRAESRTRIRGRFAKMDR